MNKNRIFNFLLVLSLTLQISASVNEIKEKQSYFNCTRETIEKVNSGRNIALYIMGLPLIYYLNNNNNNNLQFLIGSISLISAMSCFIIGKPEDEQPLPSVKIRYAIPNWDKLLTQHYEKNPERYYSEFSIFLK